MISRRLILVAPLGLVACQGVFSSATPSSIITDVQTLVKGLQQAFKVVEGQLPATQAAQIGNYLELAASVTAGLLAGLPATSGAALTQQIEGYVNDAVDVAASISVIPAPFNVSLQAAVVILPVLEAFVNQYIPTKAVSAPSAFKSNMTLQQALQVLSK